MPEALLWVIVALLAFRTLAEMLMFDALNSKIVALNAAIAELPNLIAARTANSLTNDQLATIVQGLTDAATGLNNVKSSLTA